jgi:hypothetical protein
MMEHFEELAIAVLLFPAIVATKVMAIHWPWRKEKKCPK